MKSRWYNIYCEEINSHGGLDSFVKEKIGEKRLLIKKILGKSKNGKLIESGCGTGIISGHLASLGKDITCLDIDIDILNLAKKISKKRKISISYCLADMKKMPFKKDSFEVCFHNGVLEHFNDVSIKKILKEQFRISKTVVFGVPTNFFKEDEKIYGDERFLPIEYWRNLIGLVGGFIEDEFYFYHSTTSFKIKLIKLIDKITSHKFKFKRPFVGFVISHGR